MARLWVVVALVGVVACITGCGPSPTADSPSSERPVVVATVDMVGDVAAYIGGDRVEVRTLISPGIDPHLHDATRSDIEQLLAADLILYCGLNLEARLTGALEQAGSAGTPVVAVAETIDRSKLLLSAEADEEFDPHAWMDPTAWVGITAVITTQLSAIDPEGRAEFERRAGEYAEQVTALDAYAERVLSSVPEGQRVLVTAHDAFGYFASRYGFEVMGIQGLSTDSEAGVLRIEELVETLVSRRIGAVFVESTVSDAHIRALIEGAGAENHTVTIGGELFSDAMGEEGTYEGTYLGMIDHNATTVARALGGDAPERGMNGRLGAP